MQKVKNNTSKRIIIQNILYRLCKKQTMQLICMRGCSIAMFISIAVLSITFVTLASAADYYVAKTGLDSNAGTEAEPFLTIQKAADVAQAGSTVYVGSGTYNEYIRPAYSGTSTAQTTYVGTRDSNGEWLTIIDGSDSYDYNWTLDTTLSDPEDPDVKTYKTTAIPYDMRALSIDNQAVTRIRNSVMSGATDPVGRTHDYYFTLDRDATDTSALESTIVFWDATYAVTGYLNDNGTHTTYLRLRDGDYPDSDDFTIRSSKHGAAINLESRSYHTFRDFLIRGGEVGVRMCYCEGNIIEDCKIMRSGAYRIHLLTDAHDNIIRRNIITQNFYGYNGYGAWTNATDYLGEANDDDHQLKSFMYRFHKILPTEDGTPDNMIFVQAAGSNNEISGNVLYGGYAGIWIISTYDLDVSENTIHGFSSIGVFFSRVNVGPTLVEVHDNLLYDNNIQLRIGNINEGVYARTLYFYRNRCWNPGYIGMHIYHHMNPEPDPETPDPDIWIYHNTFAGGNYALKYSSLMDENDGLPGAHYVNNIMSARAWGFIHPNDVNFMGIASYLGCLDYNWVGGVYEFTEPAWFGDDNVYAENEELWTVSMTDMPHFLPLPDTCGVWEAGLDVSTTFTVGTTEYSALPGMSSGYYYGSYPDIGAVQMGAGAVGDRNYRMKLTLDNAESSEDLSDFTALVKLDDSRFNYLHAQDDAEDIRFTDSDGVTPLKYEIEEWDTDGTSAVWLKVPTMRRHTNDGCIYMYYDDSLASDGQDASNTWNSQTKAVWHLNESTGTRYDSTANNNDGSPVNYDGDEAATAQVAGGGDQLDGVNDRLFVSHSTSLAIPSKITLSIWMKPDTTSASHPGMLFAKYYGNAGYRMYYAGTQQILWRVNPLSGTMLATSENAITTGEWNYIVATYDDDNDTMAIYVNGVLNASRSVTETMASTEYYTSIGGYGSYFDGTIDEARVIQGIVLSPEWIKAEYRSMTDNMITYGSEEELLP